MKKVNGPASRSYFSTKLDKIGILQPNQKQLSFAAPKTSQKTKTSNPMNYSDVFYSDKRTVLHIGKSPRENLKDLFNGDVAKANSTMKGLKMQ